MQRFQDESGFIFMVDTLEYLQKGGRIGRASSIAGGLLNIKPLLTLTDGEVDVYKKVRGETKALRGHARVLPRADTARPHGVRGAR